MFKHILQTNEFETILVDKAEGSWIWDVEGNKYLDCTSGVWCLHLGHNHPDIIQTIRDQSEKLIHRNNRFLTPVTIEAAETILKFIPGDFNKITFLNSGSEAVEFAIILAKKITGRNQIISLQDSYCGAYGTAKSISYTSGIEDKLKIPYGTCKTDNCTCLEGLLPTLDELFSDESFSPAGFVLEPIIVSGGIQKPCKEYIEEVCKRVREVGGLIITNEVTTGFGRSGKKFGFMHYNIEPDIIALGKSLGAGYPISAIATYSHLEAKIPQNQKYYVQSHQLDPLGAAIAKTFVEIIEAENIIEGSQKTIRQLSEFLSSIDYPFVKEIRSFGMIIGVQIQSYQDKTSKEIIIAIKDQLLKEGIMIGLSLGKNLLRILPPLNLRKEELEFFIDKISLVFGNIKKNMN